MHTLFENGIINTAMFFSHNNIKVEINCLLCLSDAAIVLLEIIFVFLIIIACS